MDNVVHLKINAPMPSLTSIICPECEGDTWRIVTEDRMKEVLGEIILADYICAACGTVVPVAIMWPEGEE